MTAMVKFSHAGSIDVIPIIQSECPMFRIKLNSGHIGTRLGWSKQGKKQRGEEGSLSPSPFQNNLNYEIVMTPG